MNKFFIFILCLCCALTVAQATGEDRLNDSDANVFGHVLDKKTGEHLPFINVLLFGLQPSREMLVLLLHTY